MRLSTRLAGAVTGASLAAGLAMTGLPAGAGTIEVTDVSSSSGVMDVDLDFNGATLDVGPTPYTELHSPTQGAKLTELGYNYNDEITTGALTASTDAALGEGGFAAAGATAEEVSIAFGLTEVLAAEEIRAECRHDGGKGGGVTTITDGVAELATDLADNPEPNTEIDLAGIGTLTLNRQVVSGDGRIDVTAVVLDIDIPSVAAPVTGTITIGQVTCDAEAAEVEATPTQTEVTTEVVESSGPVEGTPTATG